MEPERLHIFGRTYASLALPPRPIAPDLLEPIGTAEGATWFVERNTNSETPGVLYVLVAPECLFQPYWLSESAF